MESFSGNVKLPQKIEIKSFVKKWQRGLSKDFGGESEDGYMKLGQTPSNQKLVNGIRLRKNPFIY